MKCLEPIAIVGIGCRFPGEASSPEKLWELLCKGFDGIVDIPANRWDVRRFYHADPAVPGKMYIKRGGFLSTPLDHFDAAFFHLSPREADTVDPQQRLLLEVAWEAMEDGGIVPSRIKGSQTGVFVGAFMTDWQMLNNSPYNTLMGDAYTGINASQTVLSARLAYFFDFKGPCLTVDTACSSSLVAVHLACQSIWTGACSMALAGGVNAMLVPEPTIAMSKGRFLNPEGYCRSFDAEAKGYSRGEGAGLVVLKTLSQALEDGDPVYAVIRGTGINHDGQTNGLALPNPKAQQDLIASVLRQTQIDPSDIQYVEAHGTGTPVGDPMEAWALDQVLQRGSQKKCLIGSIKSNIGHLEAAAGVAGLIKTALCLKHRVIPPNIHFNTPNPSIPFEDYCVEVSKELQPFPNSQKRLFAGVNSFGYGGTNAHAILEEPPLSSNDSEGSVARPVPIPFSAKSREALQEYVGNVIEFLQQYPDLSLNRLVYTLAQHREYHSHRLCILAKSVEELQQRLVDYHRKGEGLQAVQGEPLETVPKVAFVYTGMGPQWWGMGRELAMQEPVFRQTLETCDAYLKPLTGWSLLEELAKDEQQSQMDQPEYAQPANFALQAALTDLLKSWGVVPEGVVGHSIGEVASAYASGSITLQEGIRVSYYRSQLQARRKGQGTMLAAEITQEQAMQLISTFSDQVSIGAINGPSSLTLSGEEGAVRAIGTQLDAQGTFNRIMKVNIAYHSLQMEGIQEDVLHALHSLKPKAPAIPLFSTVTGHQHHQPLEAQYWWQNIRQPVLFNSALKEMVQQGYNLFIEIGPHPVLSKAIKDTLHQAHRRATSFYTLNRKEAETEALTRLMARLHIAGVSLCWERLLPLQKQLIPLPRYAWQRTLHWKESEESKQYRLSHPGHPMLARRAHCPEEAWMVEVNTGFFPWLEDHKIDGSTVFPAAAYVEGCLALLKQHGSNETCILENIDFRQALVVNSSQEPLLRITYLPQGRQFQIHSWAKEWTLHATAKCQTVWKGYVPFKLAKDKVLEKCPNELTAEEIYPQFARHGLMYGPAFRLLRHLYQGTGEALGQIDVPTYRDPYHLPPPVLDAALHTLVGVAQGKLPQEGLILPVHIDEVHFFSSLKERIWCHAKETHRTSETFKGDLILYGDDGTPCVELRGVTCRLFKSPKKDLKTLLEQWVYRFEEKEIIPSVMTSVSEQTIFYTLSKQPEEELLRLVKSFDPEKKHTLWVVSQGIEHSGLWGLTRVIRQEMPYIQCRLIDWDPKTPFDEKELMSLLSGVQEDEVTIRNGKLFSKQILQGCPSPEIFSESQIYELELSKPGLIENLHYRNYEKKLPSKGEVAIRVHTASLNFKDLMKVLGLLDQNVVEGTYFGNSFGMECSGTVIAVGAGVRSYRVGDQVCAFARNTFCTDLICSAQAICPIPPGSTLEKAPIFIPFLTVLRGLKEIAQLKKGETVLIHSATGAVGLAAIQYAQHVGAKIIATAGNQEKREYLHQMGIEWVADSRSLQFARQVREWTQGKGVDVILNALSGETLIKSWELLASYGRFIEIGKRDISLNSGLPMEVFQRNTLFAAIDLDRTFIEDKKIIQRLIRETLKGFQKGFFKPLPCEVYAPSQVHEAFHQLARAKHIGKIMIRFEGEKTSVKPSKIQKPLFHAQATYLVAGGLRGFGLATAQWIAAQGGRHLILLSKQGPVTSEAQAVIQAMKQQGINVKAIAADVSESLEPILSPLLKKMPPLKGIFHAAMVLDDDWLGELTPERFQKVMQPKVTGCWNLHTFSLEMNLDYFVLYSSIASLIGNPGQGSYAAANAFLDAFASYRHQMGVPALTINWGAIAEVGAVSRQASIAAHLQHHGIQPLAPQQAFQVLGHLLQQGGAQYGVMQVDWAALLSAMPQLKQTILFGEMKVVESASVGSDFQHHLRSLDPEAQLTALIQCISEKVAHTLKIDASRIEVKKKLSALGVDSLMAMELQHLMEQTLKFRIPTMELMKGPSIEELARSTQRHLNTK